MSEVDVCVVQLGDDTLGHHCAPPMATMLPDVSVNTSVLVDSIEVSAHTKQTTSIVVDQQDACEGKARNPSTDTSGKVSQKSVYDTIDAERLAVLQEDLINLPVDIATILSECLINRGSHPIEASKRLLERCKEHLSQNDKNNNYVKNVMNSLDKIVKRGRRVAGSRALSVVTLAACIIHVTLVFEMHIYYCNSKTTINEVGGQIVETIEPINKKKMKLLQQTFMLFRHIFQSPYLLEEDKLWIFHPWCVLTSTATPLPNSASKENKENIISNMDRSEKAHVPAHDGASTVSDYTESTVILSDNQSPVNSKSGSSSSKQRKNMDKPLNQQHLVSIKFKDVVQSLQATYPFATDSLNLIFNDDVDDEERVEVKDTTVATHALFTETSSSQSPAPLAQSLSMSIYSTHYNQPSPHDNNNNNNNKISKPLTTLLSRTQSKLNSRTGVNTKRISVIVSNSNVGTASKSKIEPVSRGKGIAELAYNSKNQYKPGIPTDTSVSSQYAKVKRAISMSGMSNSNTLPASDGTRYSRDDVNVRRTTSSSQYGFNTLKRTHQSLVNDTPVSSKYRVSDLKRSRSSVMSSIIQDTPIRNDQYAPPSSVVDRYPRDSSSSSGSQGCTCAVYRRLSHCACTFSKQLK